MLTMKKIISFFLFLFFFIGNSQNSADISQNFGSISGFDGSVYASAIQSDGKILVGGNFFAFKGVNAKFLTRLNPDGSIDTSFSLTGTGFSGAVFSIAIQNDGKILVGGYFTSFDGIPQGRIIRLNTDGSKDTSFNTGNGFNDHVFSIKVQIDGKILVGGQFTTYKGITQNRLVRLNSNGIIDTGFYIGTGFGNWYVSEINVQNDHKIIVIGEFGTFNDVLVNKIVRLNIDGSKDLTFNTGTGFGFNVNNPPLTWPIGAITIQNDGKILIGGSFYTYNGVSQNNIIRLNTDGTKDTSFLTGTGPNNRINSIDIQSDGKILIGGDFSSYNNVLSVNKIARLNTNGVLDTSLNTQGGFNNSVNCLSIQNDGNIIVGGFFISYDGVLENRIMGLTATGAKNYSFNNGLGFDTFVNATSQQADGKIIVTGAITNYKGIAEKKIIRLNTDGTKDTSFNTGTGFNNNVSCIAKQNDGKIIVGGEFTSFNGITENYIIRLNTNGTKDTSFNTGTGFNNIVNTITIQSDGKILVGGNFNLYKGVLQNKIIRLNNDGTKDTSFNPGTGFDNSINVITLQNDGKILIGGTFTAFNGLQENRAIRLNDDGTKDTSFNINAGFNESVLGITLQPDGKIFIYGNFGYLNNILDKKIVRLNTDGSRDASFNTGTGFNLSYIEFVKSIIIQNDGKIVVAGTFNTYKGLAENNIIRLLSDGNKDTSFDAGIGFNNKVNCLTSLNDGSILVGGNFTSYKNLMDSSFLVALNGSNLLSNYSFNKPNSITIWPNPAKEIINVDLLNNTLISSIKIYDLQGKLIHESKDKTISIGTFSSGLYVIKVTTEEGEFTKKFIKE